MRRYETIANSTRTRSHRGVDVGNVQSNVCWLGLVADESVKPPQGSNRFAHRTRVRRDVRENTEAHHAGAFTHVKAECFVARNAESSQ
jgi:hypothetical protein